MEFFCGQQAVSTALRHVKSSGAHLSSQLNQARSLKSMSCFRLDLREPHLISCWMRVLTTPGLLDSGLFLKLVFGFFISISNFHTFRLGLLAILKSRSGALHLYALPCNSFCFPFLVRILFTQIWNKGIMFLAIVDFAK